MKNKFYAIYACEETFGGSHGIEDYEVIIASSLKEAEQYGKNMSAFLIQNTPEVLKALEQEVKNFCKKYPDETEEDAREEIYNDDLDYFVTELDDELLPTFDLYVLNQKYRDDPYDFCLNYRR